MVHIANRLSSFNSAEFQEVFRKQQTIKDPIDLSIGVPEELTPEHIKAAGIAAIRNDQTVYTPANGILELREAIATKLETENDIIINPEQVTVVPGLTTGLLLVYLALHDPGDEIIVMDPYYPPYAHLTSAIGAYATLVPTLSSFQLDIEAIEQAITSKTRAIVINSPNNPTGAVYSRNDLLKVVEIAEKNNLYILSDEIYEHFVSEGNHFSIGSVYQNTITMNGFSKGYAMTGWRIGYISGPSEIIAAINQLQQYIVFSSSSIAQHAALAALRHPRMIADVYHHKRQLALKRLRAMGYRINGAHGAYYIFFQVPTSDIDFVERAADQSLLLLPGRAFSQRQDFVRISYGADLPTLTKGLDILENLTNRVQ